jgi:hypothetical protein
MDISKWLTLYCPISPISPIPKEMAFVRTPELSNVEQRLADMNK